MYQIKLKKDQDTKVEVNLDGVQLLRLPAVVFAGIGDKKKRYMAYLEKNFTDGKNLYHVLCHLHVLGIRNGSITLLSHPKNISYHAAAIKEFLEKNLETLNMITPYVFQNEKDVLEKIAAHTPTVDVPEETKSSIRAMMGINDAPAVPVQLSEDDWAQINAHIAADQAKEAAANKETDDAGTEPSQSSVDAEQTTQSVST